MINKKIGLALSGGGYRATIYHLGTLRKLRELGILNKIDVISSNSGGSITAAAYSLGHKDFSSFETLIKDGVKQEITWRILFSPKIIFSIAILIALFTSRIWSPVELPSFIFTIINLVVVLCIFLFQFQIFPISKIIEKKYDKIFFKKKKLKELSDSFKTTINSTNIETGRLFYFSKERMTDSTYSHPKTGKPITFKHDNFPIARAVMASSSVPGAFTPIRINKSYFTNVEDAKKVLPKLVDGGVYDNQGIHKLTFPTSSSYCRNVIVSDAGNFLSTDNWSFNSLLILMRIGSIFMTRIKNFQMMSNLYRSDTYSIVAFQSLGFDLEKSIGEFMNMIKNGHIKKEVLKGHGIKEELIERKEWTLIENQVKVQIDYDKLLAKGCDDSELQIARNVRTGLSRLSDDKINALIKHAEAITELQVKLFLPHIL